MGPGIAPGERMTAPRMPRQMWAFLCSLVAALAAMAAVVLGAFGWAAMWAMVAIAAGKTARDWSHRAPAPMPHWMRWVLYLPRTFQSAERLQAILHAQPGERLLEIGPGVGIHALPVARRLAPSGVLDVMDVQRPMLRDLVRRARQAEIDNVRPVVGDAQRLPYGDRSLDAVYLLSVLGEVPDADAALRELRRVLKPRGRIVIGEIMVDPDFIAMRALQRRMAAAGFTFERRSGPSFAYLASFRTPVLARAA